MNLWTFLHFLQLLTKQFKENSLKSGLTWHLNWHRNRIFYSYWSYMWTVNLVMPPLHYTQEQVYSGSLGNSHSLMLWCKITFCTYIHSDKQKCIYNLSSVCFLALDCLGLLNCNDPVGHHGKLVCTRQQMASGIPSNSKCTPLMSF